MAMMIAQQGSPVEDTTVLNNRGFYYACLRRVSPAISALTRAIELENNFGIGYFNRGNGIIERNIIR
jgi:hypothetical protein